MVGGIGPIETLWLGMLKDIGGVVRLRFTFLR